MTKHQILYQKAYCKYSEIRNTQCQHFRFRSKETKQSPRYNLAKCKNTTCDAFRENNSPDQPAVNPTVIFSRKVLCRQRQKSRHHRLSRKSGKRTDSVYCSGRRRCIYSILINQCTDQYRGQVRHNKLKRLRQSNL